MRNEKYLFLIATLISLLIILIPVALATEINTYDNSVLKTSEQRIDLYQSPDREPFERGYLSDPGKACVSQHEETSKYADKLDSGVISVLENVVSILYMICTVFSAIDTVIDALGLALGMWPDCCWDAATGVGAARCSAMGVKFRVWSLKYIPIQQICCFLNDGWCGFATCYGLGGANVQKITKVISLTGIRPKDSIYLSMACGSPVGILYNLRKLKTIYQFYDCCIQEACENGLSTEACERQLDEATCMYYEGSLDGIMAKILMAVAAAVIAVLIQELIGNAIAGMVLSCAYAILKLAQVPDVIGGVQNTWQWASRSFNEPQCKDLDFEDIKEELEIEWEDVSLLDADHDGIYDTEETYNYMYADGSIRYNTVSYDSYEITGNKLKLNKEGQDPIEIDMTEDKTAKDFFANSLDMNKNYELGKVKSVSADGSRVTYEEGGTVDIQKGTSEDPTTLTINIDDKTTTETRYHNGDVLTQEGDKWKYKTNERKKILGLIPSWEKVTIEGEGTPDAERLKQVIEQAQKAGVDIEGAKLEVEGDNYNFEKEGLESTFTKEQISQSETINGINIERMTDIKTRTDSVKLTKAGKEYQVPTAVLEDIGKENIEDIETVGGETVITYGEGKTANIKGDTTTFYNPDGTKTGRILEVKDKTLTEIQGDQRTDTRTLEDEQGNIVRITEEYEKNKIKVAKLDINGRITEADPGLIERVKTNPEEVAQAFNGLDNPDKLGYAKQDGAKYYFTGDDFAKTSTTLQISDDGKTTTLTEWGKDPETGKRVIKQKDTVIDKTFEDRTKETEILYDDTDQNNEKSRMTVETNMEGKVTRIIGIDEKGKNYDYDIDPETGKSKNLIYYGDLIIDTSIASKKGQIEIYGSEGTFSTVDEYEIGFDNNGEMWLKDNKGEWTKASDEKYQSIREDDYYGAKLEELQEQGKAAMELKKQGEDDAKAKIEEKEEKPPKKETKKVMSKPLFSAQFLYAYDMASTFLIFLIGDRVQKEIEDQCKEDAEKSYPPSDTPTDSGGEETMCGDIDYNIYNAQFIGKTELDQTCEYQVSYSIKTCGSAIDYTILLAGTGNDQMIEISNVGFEVTISRNRIITSNFCTHQTICITASDGHNQCYPPLP